jgi:hypothetical protein
VFYSYFYLYPTLTGNYSKISFDKVWETDPDKLVASSERAMIYTGLFAFFSSNLLIAIVRTIGTNPGNIPDHKEWDMSTDQSEMDSGSDAPNLRHHEETKNEQGGTVRFSNNVIDRNTKDPKEIVHEDYKYLQTKEGPLIQFGS